MFTVAMATREGRTRRGPKIWATRQIGAVAQLIFPAEVTIYAEKIPVTADKLDRAPRWQRGLG